MALESGGQYAFESAHHSPLVKNESVLIYSTAVRQNGQLKGKAMGVLGILFDWEGLAQTIVNQTPLAASEKEATRCLIADREGNVLADSFGKQLKSHVPKAAMRALESAGDVPKGYAETTIDGVPHCVGFARAPGYETYSTDWISFVYQPLNC